ncbi:MAG: glycine zipper 2TM domain-containing protein [Nitrococcus mobilis]|nr:glycine zipper 2TM domain-containing protein [Nitrococcus mobilis]
MSKLLGIGLCAASAALAPVAQATDYGNYGMDYARVIHVEPIYREVAVTTPQRECYEQPVYHNYRVNRDGDGALAAIVGGVVGGVIGHNLGRGRHRAPVTIAGTLAGVGIGHSMARQRNDYYAEQVSYRRVCQVVHDTRYERHVDGYDVTYRYRGETYHTRMPYDPGPRLRVQVDVTPVLGN